MNTEYMNIAMNKGMLFADNIPLLPNNMPLLTDKNGDGYVSSNGAFFSSLSASHIINLLPPHQRTYPLQVPVATTDKEHLLYDVVLVSSHVNGPASIRPWACT